MKLSIKNPCGKVEVFDNVDNWSFAILRQQVVRRFSLNRNFSLFFGSHQLPTNDVKLIESGLGFVSGDRLRLVMDETELPASDRLDDFCNVHAKDDEDSGSNSSAAKKCEAVGAIFETVFNEMKREGFECIQRSDDTRYKFRHPDTVLLTEIDFRVYDDARAKCAHVTASIYHPAGRRFLESVVLKEKSDDLRKTVSEYLVSPLKLALLGHENPLLRFLGNSSVAESLFELLPARSILRLERTNKYALELCRNERMERVWQTLIRRDFGKDACIKKNEPYRDAYKRMYIEQVRRRQEMEHEFERNPIDLRWLIPNPLPPGQPGRPRVDPDVPEGPFSPVPDNPFIPPTNPFPSIPRLRNPLDPFGGSELLPSRPTRPGGMPRQFPRGPRFHDWDSGGII